MNHQGELQLFDAAFGADASQLAQPLASAGNALDEQLRIHEYERQRMGQELHDCAGQLLVSLQLSIAHLACAQEAAEHDSVIDEIRQTVGQIDREIRALAFLDYPAQLGERGLCGTVQSLVRGFAQRTGIHATFRCVGDGAGISEPIAVVALRVIQEGLVNIHRHAHASRARVCLERRHDELRMTIGDNGIGMRLGNGSDPGIGLQGMRHRVEAIGGRFRIANLTHGTRISACVPLCA
jgi:signal transduction histidine kinase